MLSVKRFTHELSGSSGASDTAMIGLLDLGFPFIADEQTLGKVTFDAAMTAWCPVLPHGTVLMGMVATTTLTWFRFRIEIVYLWERLKEVVAGSPC